MQTRFTMAELIKIFSLPLILILCMHAVEGGAVAETKERITVGAVEEVVLLPWKIKLPARIDTGANCSSLDARDIRITGGMIEFRLPEKYGGTLLRLPVKGRRNIRSAGSRMKRALVEIEICIGTKRILTAVNLTERPKMEYPLLIGRNVLANDFIVDVSESYLVPPTCLTGTPK